MEKNILILLMSCNNALYEKEEIACRDTFLKDAEGENISYYFYKSVNETHPEEMVDEETHTIYLNTPDNLLSTAKKTTRALAVALSLNTPWDYVIKTNVSTYLNIKNIVKAANKWEGKDDDNIYGARFIVNEQSLHVPFPRGHFTMISHSMAQNILPIANKLSNDESLPGTDDTIIGLSLLYYAEKLSEKKYLDRLREIPAVNAWLREELPDTPEVTDALCIRCKSEPNKGKTPQNLQEIHTLLKSGSLNKKKTYRRKCSLVETTLGLMHYDMYSKLVMKLKKLQQNK